MEMEQVARRRLIRSAAALAAGLPGAAALARCGAASGVGGGERVGPRASLAPAQLRFTYWAAPDQVALYERFAARFTEQHPGVTLAFELTPFGEYFTKLLTHVSSGTAPDVGWHHSSQIQLHIVRG